MKFYVEGDLVSFLGISGDMSKAALEKAATEHARRQDLLYWKELPEEELQRKLRLRDEDGRWHPFCPELPPPVQTNPSLLHVSYLMLHVSCLHISHVSVDHVSCFMSPCITCHA